MQASVASHVDALVQQGLAASRSGDSSAAIDLFRQACAAQPSSAAPNLLLGAELAQRGEVDAAQAAFAHAVLLAPDLDIARFQLGLLQFTSGRPALALVTWAPLLDRPADQPLQRIVAGFRALAVDDVSAAHECFAQSLRLAESNGANAPLMADVRMVMAKIAPLAQARNPVPAAADPGAPEADAMHVLLSNYARQGRADGSR